jgi:PEP-CTERM motif
VIALGSVSILSPRSKPDRRLADQHIIRKARAAHRLHHSNIIGTITAAVPDPSTWAMMILGFASVGVMGYRRRNKTAMLRVA